MRVFKSRAIIEVLTEDEQQKLVDDFKVYQSGGLPDLFGRDVLYDHPSNLPSILTEQVRHIHLATSINPWSIKTIQFYRTSDEYLVYCQGALCEDHYLLMAILSPRAHDKARNNNVMSKLGFMAEKFRSKF